MIEDEITARSALRTLDRRAGSPATGGRLVLVAARAGVGKTALLVQVAIDALLHGHHVLHVSLGETLSHVKRWYEGVYRDLTVGMPADAVRAAWERAERSRMLMVFRHDAFRADRLAERMRLLETQGVFAPRLVVADGFLPGHALRADAEVLGRVCAEKGIEMWLAVRTPLEIDDVGAVVDPVAGLFETIIALEPQAGAVVLREIRRPPGVPPVALRLDPGTMLVTAAR